MTDIKAMLAVAGISLPELPELTEGCRQALREKHRRNSPTHDKEIHGDKSDELVADAVRMLMRNDLDHEAIVVDALDRIISLVLKVEDLERAADASHCRIAGIVGNLDAAEMHVKILRNARTAAGVALPPQAEVLDWAVRSFGPIAKNPDERAARVTEEAIEIAQVEGVPLETVKRIADRVYSRPAGERGQEIGGCVITLLAYAELVGRSVAGCAKLEFNRVLSKPRDWWEKKHAEKVAAGTANLSPAKTP